VIITFTAGLFM